MRGGTSSPFEIQYPKNAKKHSIAVKALEGHPLDELEAVVPNRIEQKYESFQKDLLAMFSLPQNNLEEIDMRQKEVRLYAKKHNLAATLLTEWPQNLIFYLIIFERMEQEEIFAIKEYEQLGWSPETLSEARGIAESLEFKREIYAYKGILEDVMAMGGLEQENQQEKAEPKKNWVDELRSPSSEESYAFKERVNEWSESEQKVFRKQIEETNYSQSEIEEMITGRDFIIETYDY